MADVGQVTCLAIPMHAQVAEERRHGVREQAARLTDRLPTRSERESLESFREWFSPGVHIQTLLPTGEASFAGQEACPLCPERG